MLSRFRDIWISSTYIYTSDWSGSCSEEGPLFEGALPRPLYVTAYQKGGGFDTLDVSCVRRTPRTRILATTRD